MNKIPLVDLKRQYAQIKDEVASAMQRVMNDTDFIMGADVKEFEQTFSRMTGIRHMIGVSSGTSALLLGLMALGIKPGDKIITTANTFIATVEPMIFLGAKPVFVDVDEYGAMDIDLVEKAITPEVKGIVAVHLYGRMLDVVRLRKICDDNKIFLLEDCAQSHFAEFQGKVSGSVGDVAAYSFYPGKNLGAFGDAGAVGTSDSALFENISITRNHGRKTKYEHEIDGLGERLDTLQAAVLNVKLKYIEGWTEKRIQVAKKYHTFLSGISGLILPPVEGKRNVFHLFVIQVEKNRDRILEYLKAEGIQASIHYPIPLHLQPVYYPRAYGGKNISLPATESFAGRILSLPIFPEISESEIKTVADRLKYATDKYL
ncbi:DegT/DnrJ/EryC1/StrS family aminotransferase [bacterium]|nr:DegT/DnrJ/EryC1/StrS family aminotransferase [bacterium]